MRITRVERISLLTNPHNPYNPRLKDEFSSFCGLLLRADGLFLCPCLALSAMRFALSGYLPYTTMAYLFLFCFLFFSFKCPGYFVQLCSYLGKVLVQVQCFYHNSVFPERS